MQWEKGDIVNGLTVLLCGRTASMRKGNSTYANRQLIAQEFQYFNRDEDRMWMMYGSLMERNKTANLVATISKNRALRHQQGHDTKKNARSEPFEAQEVDKVNCGENMDEDEEGQSQKEGQGGTSKQGMDSMQAQTIPLIRHWKEAI